MPRRWWWRAVHAAVSRRQQSIDRYTWHLSVLYHHCTTESVLTIWWLKCTLFQRAWHDSSWSVDMFVWISDASPFYRTNQPHFFLSFHEHVTTQLTMLLLFHTLASITLIVICALHDVNSFTFEYSIGCCSCNSWETTIQRQSAKFSITYNGLPIHRTSSTKKLFHCHLSNKKRNNNSFSSTTTLHASKTNNNKETTSSKTSLCSGIMSTL